ncbi:MAG TPA: molybdenum cofactor guanylyltransferase [Nitrolancea sp.]|nr:molybdenum cofactor guanylyltransferase [Nitrolancea sp.]
MPISGEASALGSQHPLSVAILAGGQSRRMGQDKALLQVQSRTLLERVIERAGTIASEIFIVAYNRPEYERFGLRVVPDRFPHSGSLGGIYTGISEAIHDACLVLACDLPFVNVALLSHMASLPRDYDVLVPALAAERSGQGGKETLETLHAIYGKACEPVMEERLRAGAFKIVEAFTGLRVRRILEAEVRAFDPELLSFFNANTPEEFAWVQQRLADLERGPGTPFPA